MDVRQLRYFVEIVERGSIKQAAQTLFVAQPSLSQHVRNLEAELGVPLLTRTTRGVSPTEAGTQLIGYARSILAQVDQAREAIRAGGTDPHGSVRVGLPNSVSLVLSVPLVERAYYELPNVSLRVVESMSGYVLDWLCTGQLDLAMLFGAQRAPGIHLRTVLTESLYLVGLPTRKLRRSAKTVPMSVLADTELIMPARPHGLRELVEREARHNGLRLRIHTEIDALSQIKALVRRGLGYSVLSHSAVYAQLRRGELHAWRIANPVLERSVFLAEPTDRPMTSAMRAMADLMESCARDLVVNGRWHAVLPPSGRS